MYVFLIHFKDDPIEIQLKSNIYSIKMKKKKKMENGEAKTVTDIEKSYGVDPYTVFIFF